MDLSFSAFLPDNVTMKKRQVKSETGKGTEKEMFFFTYTFTWFYPFLRNGHLQRTRITDGMKE